MNTRALTSLARTLLLVVLFGSVVDPQVDAVQKRKRKKEPPAIGCNYVVCTGVTAERTEIGAGERVRLQANASDPDGDTLIYRWETTGGTVSGDGAAATFDATGVAVGTYTITVSVTDGFHPPVECSITIRIIDSERAPN